MKKGKTHEIKKKERREEQSTVEENALNIFLDKQKKFYERAMARQYTAAKLLIYQRELKKISMREEELNAPYNKKLKREVILEAYPGTEMKWMGMPYPKELLVLDHDIELNNFKELLREETKLKDILIDFYKLTEDEVNTLYEGNYFTELKKGVKIKEKPKQDYVG